MAAQIATTIAAAVRQQDGEALSRALEVTGPALVAELTSGKVNLEQLCGGSLEEPYDEVLLYHFHSLIAASKGEAVDVWRRSVLQLLIQVAPRTEHIVNHQATRVRYAEHIYPSRHRFERPQTTA